MRGLGHAVGLDHRARRRPPRARPARCGGSGADDERMKRSVGRASRLPGCARARARIAWCMVGTAVYQVGRSSPASAKKRNALKPGRAADRAAGARARRACRHQPVDVEERHHVQAAVGGRERERGARCCAPRRRGSRCGAARASAARSCRGCGGAARRRPARRGGGGAGEGLAVAEEGEVAGLAGEDEELDAGGHLGRAAPGATIRAFARRSSR